MLRLNYDELDNEEWGEYYLWQGQPFTGIAYELHPNGQVWSEVEMMEGMENGIVRQWYASGKQRLDGYGKQVERYSWSKEWFENGVLKRVSISEWNVQIKEKIWDEQGQLISDYERPRDDKLITNP